LIRILGPETQDKGEAAVRLEITVPEVVDIIKQIQEKPERIFPMNSLNVKEAGGYYKRHRRSCRRCCGSSKKRV
jgi:hypothetical protein